MWFFVCYMWYQTGGTGSASRNETWTSLCEKSWRFALLFLYSHTVGRSLCSNRALTSDSSSYFLCEAPQLLNQHHQSHLPDLWPTSEWCNPKCVLSPPFLFFFKHGASMCSVVPDKVCTHSEDGEDHTIPQVQQPNWGHMKRSCPQGKPSKTNVKRQVGSYLQNN